MFERHDVISHIADFICNTKRDDIPTKVQSTAISCLVDFIGVSYLGTHHKNYKILLNRLATSTTNGKSYVFGLSSKHDYKTAAFLNGFVGHVMDFDDTSYEGITHPSATVFPASFALGQEKSITGDDLLIAYIIGMEVHMAFGRSLGDAFYHRGNWTSSVLGNLSATAAVCRVLNLNIQQTKYALATSFGTTYGLRSLHATAIKAAVIGRINRDAIENGLLSLYGLDTSEKTLTGTFGFINVNAMNNFNHNEFFKLGDYWSIQQTGLLFKLYPICSAGQSACDAVSILKQHHNINSDDILSINCETTKLAYESMIIDIPNSAQECQFSLKYSIACIALDNILTADHLTEKSIARPDIKKMINKITSVQTDALNKNPEAPEGAIITIQTKDKRYTLSNPTAVGMPSKPLSNQQKLNKFISCTKNTFDNPEYLYKQILDIQKSSDISTLFKLYE